VALAALVLAVPACRQATDDPGPHAGEPVPGAPGSVLDCKPAERAGFQIELLAGAQEAILRLPAALRPAEVALARVRAASGARYRGDDVEVWTKGAEASLAVDGRRLGTCRLNRPWTRARDAGVDFRAVGNEPGWHLNLREGERIELVYDYGAERFRAPAPAPVREGGALAYHVATRRHALALRITARECTDSMSGTRFAHTVQLRIDDALLRGCGRWLRPLRLGSDSDRRHHE